MSTTERTDPGGHRRDEVDHDTVPPARTGLLVLAGVLLAIPIVALLWTSSYSRVEPRLGAFPFFIWYQFVWVFLCSALTYTAYRIILVARPHRPMTGDDAHLPRAERAERDRLDRDERTGEGA
ncbi:DUF3311 domain-containing protein [Phycicoccus duodecadis]|uniref:Uncharacterized protein DUF3311 n=1 Tax=Phycicoccus duodecadis TaxID=173053 RepID=A0A2N3YH92_9MICO|nr:DUF3311 domain-containing protein [Phycicoccus duodecadis]PKW26208.1 uncharacterized protein DUF3311 [Phycicoccus duodecadis]